MFPKKCNNLPGRDDRKPCGSRYSVLIAAALQTELGGTHRAAKTVMRWTGASESAVKHWLGGRHGPSGDYLIVLMRESEAVLQAMLAAAGRQDMALAARALAAHDTLFEVMSMLRDGTSNHALPAAGDSGARRRSLDSGADVPRNDRTSDRVRPQDTCEYDQRLTQRQIWFIDRLKLGLRVNAGDLQRQWGISEKTARRDLAGLKALTLIEFVGSYKTGRYRLRQSSSQA